MGRHVFTAAQCRMGGKARAAMPSYQALQVTRGRKGYAVTCERYGAGFALPHVARYRRAHPSAAERFVCDTLLSLGYVEGESFARELVVNAGGRELLIDFAVDGPDGVLVIEPGSRRWHGGPAETIDGRDHAAGDRTRDAVLSDLGYSVLRLDAEQIARSPLVARARIMGALAPAMQEVA